jgi:hypothetical protein
MLEHVRQAKGIVHIGANQGQERDLYNSLNVPVIWVEAIPFIFKILQDNIAKYPKQKAFQYLLTDKNFDNIQFGISNNEAQSSSIFDFKDCKKVWPTLEYTHKIDLVSHTFDYMVESEKINLAEYDTS